MTSRQRRSKVSAKYKLDGEPYTGMVRKAGELAYLALERHGEPSVSIDELRAMVDKEMGHVSLTELFLKDRDARW